MSYIKKIQSEILDLESLKDLVEAYEEIAALRMRRVKKSVLQNREFMEGLNDVFQRLTYTYLKYLQRKQKSKRVKSNDTGNEKSVSVLLSSNTGLYGDITKKTFNLFIEDIVKNNSDVIIVGRYGKALFEAAGLKKKFDLFELSDANVVEEELNDLIKHLLKYKNVIVYHGLFKSVLNQEAVRNFVTGKIFDNQTTPAEEINCIVEPNIEEVKTFFEHQIFSSLFQQANYESSLSKYASRMVSLDVANENINSYIKKTRFKMLKEKHRDMNFKQISSLSGISLWNNKVYG